MLHSSDLLDVGSTCRFTRVQRYLQLRRPISGLSYWFHGSGGQLNPPRPSLVPIRARAVRISRTSSGPLDQTLWRASQVSRYTHSSGFDLLIFLQGSSIAKYWSIASSTP